MWGFERGTGTYKWNEIANFAIKLVDNLLSFCPSVNAAARWWKCLSRRRSTWKCLYDELMKNPYKSCLWLLEVSWILTWKIFAQNKPSFGNNTHLWSRWIFSFLYSSYFIFLIEDFKNFSGVMRWSWSFSISFSYLPHVCAYYGNCTS